MTVELRQVHANASALSPSRERRPGTNSGSTTGSGHRDETAAWQAAGVELRQVVSRPDGYEWAGQTGYVQSLLDNVLPTLSSPVALVCGSREMIEHTRDRLGEMGLPPEAILTNY